jgi:hypothetical protein
MCKNLEKGVFAPFHVYKKCLNNGFHQKPHNWRKAIHLLLALRILRKVIHMLIDFVSFKKSD